LEQVTHVPGEAVAGVLLLIGLGSIVGNVVGGYAIDRVGVRVTLIAACVVMMLSLLGLSVFGAVPLMVAACWSLNGVAGGMFVPAQQARLLKIAARAPELALAINLTALNFGIS